MTEPDAEAKDQIQILRPDWDIPGVDAGFTLRTGGVSKPPYDSLNLAMHVGDDPDDVRENRRRLVEFAGLPEEPRWLKQVHGNRVVHASEVERDVTEADAVWTDQPGQVCAVMVADCVPILLAAKDGSCVAAIHAGWRGLANGVLEETFRRLGHCGLCICLGPCVPTDIYNFDCKGPAEPLKYNKRFVFEKNNLDLHSTAQNVITNHRSLSNIDSVEKLKSASDLQFSHRATGRCGRVSAFVCKEKDTLE